MLLSKTSAIIASRQPVVVEGDTYFKSDWLDSGRDPSFAPTTFLVEQQPGVALRTHFHRNDQFQLFVAGRGAIGRHPVESVMVHFANGYSAYGPIVAGDTGLTWLTLRTVFESGSLTMKDHADQMRRVPKRQFHSSTIAVADPETLSSLARTIEEDVIAAQADGLVSRVLIVPPNVVADAPGPRHSNGQYRVVLAGSMIVGERKLERWEHAFVAPDERDVPLHAGPGGLQVVFLQFPTIRDRAPS